MIRSDVRILLINPSSNVGKMTHLPLGLCYLKAFLKHEGFTAKVLDATVLSDNTVRDILLKESPDIVGITCFTDTRFKTFYYARMVKDVLGDKVKVVLGGAHATHLSSQILHNYSAVDFIVSGEGERTIVDLARALDTSSNIAEVRGISYRLDGKITVNPSQTFIKDLDSIPYPDYDDLDIRNYHGPHDFCKGAPCFSIIASRSCAYECIFCSTKEFWGKVRIRSAENVVNEVKWLCEKYGAKNICFEDDAFSLRKEWAIEVCERILQANLSIKWAAQTRADRFSKEVAEMMKKAGCQSLCFGIESGDPTILKNLNKHQTVDDVVNAFKICKEAGLRGVMSLIIGSPGETVETIEGTKKLLRISNPDAMVLNALRIYPATRLFQIAKGQGLIDESVFLSVTTDLYYTGAMSESEIRKTQLKVYLDYYLHINGLSGLIRLVKFLVKQLITNPGKFFSAIFSLAAKKRNSNVNNSTAI